MLEVKNGTIVETRGRPIKDLTGERFGKLLVLSRYYFIDQENYCRRTPGKCGKGRPLWNCQCDCGVKCVKSSDSLLSKKTKSCGCLRSENGHRLTKLNLKKAAPSLQPGQRFGRLVVLGRANPRSQGRHSMWECQCDCGEKIVTRAYSLRSGATRSCGCLAKEVFTEMQRKYNESRKKQQ